MLRFGALTIPAAHEPPRPVLTPRAWNGAWINRWASLVTTSQGLDLGRPVEFVSRNGQGVLTHAEAVALIALYEAGGTFVLETDLLVPLGELPETYTAIFEPDSPPSFVPLTPDGGLYGMSIRVIIAAP